MREALKRLRVPLRAPVLLLVLAATAVPVELRDFAHHAALSFEIYPADLVENILGYVPVGLVLAGLGWLRAVGAAAIISTAAEVGQIGMMHRDPSAVDILANTVGAALGAGLYARWKIPPLELALNRWTGLGATSAACAIVLWFLIPVVPINVRGYISPGALEAQWKLDEPAGATAQGLSGHGLSGRFHNSPRRVAGVLNGANAFDGVTDSIDVDLSPSLRLAGSMTITAWINSSTFPED